MVKGRGLREPLGEKVRAARAVVNSLADNLITKSNTSPSARPSSPSTGGVRAIISSLYGKRSPDAAQSSSRSDIGQNIAQSSSSEFSRQNITQSSSSEFSRQNTARSSRSGITQLSRKNTARSSRSDTARSSRSDTAHFSRKNTARSSHSNTSQFSRKNTARSSRSDTAQFSRQNIAKSSVSSIASVTRKGRKNSTSVTPSSPSTVVLRLPSGRTRSGKNHSGRKKKPQGRKTGKRSREVDLGVSSYLAPSPHTIGIPVTGIGSPVTGIGSPVPGIGSPVPGIGSPVPGIGSPVTGIGSPLSGIGSPVPGIATPVRSIGINSPFRNIGLASPIRGTGIISPVPGLDSEVGLPGVASPITRIRSPVRGISSPIPCITSPIPSIASPIRGTGIVSPVHGFSTPVHGICSPVHGISTPVHGISTPVYGISTPVHGISSPVPKMTSKFSSIRSPAPGRPISSPLPGISSPLSGKASPLPGISSPLPGIASPIPGISSPVTPHHSLSRLSHPTMSPQQNISIRKLRNKRTAKIQSSVQVSHPSSHPQSPINIPVSPSNVPVSPSNVPVSPSNIPVASPKEIREGAITQSKTRPVKMGFQAGLRPPRPSSLSARVKQRLTRNLARVREGWIARRGAATPKSSPEVTQKRPFSPPKRRKNKKRVENENLGVRVRKQENPAQLRIRQEENSAQVRVIQHENPAQLRVIQHENPAQLSVRQHENLAQVRVRQQENPAQAPVWVVELPDYAHPHPVPAPKPPASPRWWLHKWIFRSEVLQTTLHGEGHIVVYVIRSQVIALICGVITGFLMVLALASSDWLLAVGWRQGLFEHCIDASAPTPLPFRITDGPGCYPARDEPYITASAALCIICFVLDFIATVITALGLRHKDPNVKPRYFRAAVWIMTLALIAILVALILYPVFFAQELELGNRTLWEFGWAYGVGWGSAIFLFGAVVLLLCDQEEEEILYKERTIIHAENDSRA